MIRPEQCPAMPPIWLPSPGILAGLLVLVCLVTPPSAIGNDESSGIDFATQIQPLLASKCIQCHGPGQAEAGLRLDSREAATALLESGSRAITSRHPEASELLRRVTADEFERMPPEGERLSADEVARLTQWIASGADWPNHWAYAPLEPVEPPDIADTQLNRWCRTPVDRFVVRRLQRAGLQPNPEADRRVLIRRLYFDLLGLPPLPAEVDAFVSDSAPDAYARLVDRLLASPHHVEPCARQWMDVFHYPDWLGFEHAVARDIWPYRDYLVRSFNSDKPYRQFILEQLAGDVLFPDDPHALEATGFLATGPWDLSAIQAGNMNSIDHEIALSMDRDDILSTVMTTFCSSTVHCARCHDHKFDPIAQADYYALQSVFAGISKAKRMYDSDPAIAAERKRLKTRREELKQLVQSQDPSLLTPEVTDDVADWQRRIAEVAGQWHLPEWLEYQTENGSTLQPQEDGSLLATGERPDKETYTLKVRVDLGSVTAMRLEVLADDRLPHRGPGRQDNGNLHLNEVSLAWSPEDSADSPQPAVLARAMADFNQQGWGIERAIDGNASTAWGIYPNVGQSHEAVFELGEAISHDGPIIVTLKLQQTHGGGHLIGRLRIAFGSMPPPLEINGAPLASELAAAIAIPVESRTDAQKCLLAGHVLSLKVDQQLESLPPQQPLYCGTNQFQAEGGHRPASQPRVIHVLDRGDINSPGVLATPGTLQCLPGLSGRFLLDNPQDEGARRAALARWISDSRNVLTWRSLANRIWQFHFGVGLVDTPNDFGPMGSASSHPQLPAWLAVGLRERMLLKSLHRLLVTSAVYRQSSADNTAAAALDSDNRLLWKMSRRRLDAESIRDALLRLAGNLNTEVGGPPVKHYVEGRKFGLRPEANYQTFDVHSPASRRRSVYRFVLRTMPDPFMTTLDCPDGTQRTGKRDVSITSLQALATLNDRFVVSQSEVLAAKLAAAENDLGNQVTEAFRLLFNRRPTSVELKRVTQYATKYGLANACRFLLNTNEFMFVD